MLSSVVCRSEHFNEPWFLERAKVTGLRDKHRKVWEWHAITQALQERGKLAPGMKGLGFAVGTEPLASIFAGYGAEILASDIGDEAIAVGWSDSGQHAATIEALYKDAFISRSDFDRRVSFRPVDMRDLSSLPEGEFDFVWSACSLEHLGSLQAGMDFVRRSTRLLKPGGVGVHTTEFNLSSGEETMDEGWCVLYREKDLRQLDRDLRAMDAGLAKLDLFGGDHEHDIKADMEPFHANGRVHLKLHLGGFVTTSVLLIVQN